MSYYNFNDRFWSPSEVCGQILESEEYQEPSFPARIIATIFAAFKTEKEANNPNPQVRSEDCENYLSPQARQQV